MRIKDNINTRLFTHNREVNAVIDAKQPEIDSHYKEVGRTFENTRVTTADERGISDWEDILEIIPNLLTEDLEFRRARVLRRLLPRAPITELFFYNTWLPEFLQDLPYDVDIDYIRLQLRLYIMKEYWRDLREFQGQLHQLLPANIAWLIIQILEAGYLAPAVGRGYAFVVLKATSIGIPVERPELAHPLLANGRGYALVIHNTVHYGMPA